MANSADSVEIETGITKSPITDAKTTEEARPADGITGLCMQYLKIFPVTKTFEPNYPQTKEMSLKLLQTTADRSACSVQLP